VNDAILNLILGYCKCRKLCC